MKIKKRIISILMCMCLTGTIIISDYQETKAGAVGTAAITIISAVASAWALKDIHEDAYDSYHSGTWNDIQKWAKKNWGPAGFIVTMNTEAEFFDRVLYPALVAKGILSEGDTADETSYEKVKDYVDDHYTINSNNTISYDYDMKDLFVNMQNNYMNNHTMYVAYSLDAQYYNMEYNTSFIHDMVDQYQNEYMFFMCRFKGTGAKTRWLMIPKNDYSMVNLERLTGNYSRVQFYHNRTFAKSLQAGGVVYYDVATDGTYNLTGSNPTNDMKSAGLRVMNEEFEYRSDDYDPNFSNNQINYMNNATWITNGGQQVAYIYGDLALFQSSQRGGSPYYIDNSVNTSYQNNEGDYIMTNNNSNRTTYGDITNYINDYKQETNNYPDPTNINNYITENNTTNNGGGEGSGGSGGTSGSGSVSGNGVNVIINNNPSAQNTNNNTYTDNSTTNNNFFFNLLHGGSVSGNGISGNGSGGTVSGNGSGTSGNIFDWLGDIGQVLGNLIKNLGEALLHVIQGITDLIESIVVGLPTMFFEFIGAVFGWLPEEWVSLLSLSLVCMLTYGIIKIFRG